MLRPVPTKYVPDLSKQFICRMISDNKHGKRQHNYYQTKTPSSYSRYYCYVKSLYLSHVQNLSTHLQPIVSGPPGPKKSRRPHSSPRHSNHVARVLDAFHRLSGPIWLDHCLDSMAMQQEPIDWRYPPVN